MNLHKFIFLALVILAPASFARDYIIYSIVQDIPMGYENELVKKNYYINMGNRQGVESGTTLDVFRNVSRLDPYESKKRFNYHVKVGELKVLHSEDSSSIGRLKRLETGKDTPLFEVGNFMIGDKVEVHVRK